MLRQHVFRQTLFEPGVQGLIVKRGAFAGNHIGDQAHVAGTIFTGDHYGACHLRNVGEYRFDLAQLDAIATHLDLEVQPAEMLEHAVGKPATAVAGAVHPCLRLPGKIVGKKPLDIELWPIQIAEGDASATDIDLARHTQRAGRAQLVEDIYRRVRNRTPDENAGTRLGHSPVS